MLRLHAAATALARQVTPCLMLALLALLPVGPGMVARSLAGGPADPLVVPGQYLVLLDAPTPPPRPRPAQLAALQTRKQKLLEDLAWPAATVIRAYSHLPMMALQLPKPEALEALRAHPGVRAVYPNHVLRHQLAQSLPLIRQLLPAELGFGGLGTTIAIVDTGVDFTRQEFGNCTAPGLPTTCRVTAAVDIAPDDGVRDDNGHGTHVGAIAAAVATEARLAALDVFDGNTSSDALVIDAINWAIAHQADYNIVAINLSLGDGGRHTAPCDKWRLNPYVVPVANARAAGIITVAAAGNQGYADGLNRPACTPDVVSVGAVYDANVGGIAYGVCTDSTTAADRIACFSNGASYLTILAPGALITATGKTLAGTSQAAPHVAGTLAALRAAFPDDSPAATIDRLTASAVTITDPRNGTSLPRLDEQQALGIDPEAVPGFGLLAMAVTGLGLYLMQRYMGTAAAGHQ